MKPSKIEQIIELLRQKATIKGIIAVIVAVTVLPTLIVMAVRGNATALEVLKTVLLIIIGFYFGEEVGKAKKGL